MFSCTQTLAIFAALTIFTFQSKIDFSFLGAGLFAALWVLLIWGFVISIFGYRQSFLYSLFGAFVFALYILFDTSLIMQRLSYDEYVLGAISLYLDILNLFIFLLDLLGRR
jgi:protein lifeguard